METKNATKAYQDYSRRMIQEGVSNLQRDYSFHIHFQGWRTWGRVLDFGGRIGEKTERIDNVVVIEIDDTARREMKRNGRKCQKRIDTIKNGNVDTIYCSHVLEHLENPLEYLMKFKRKLRQGGNLILVLPYEANGFNGKATDGNGHLYAWNMITINTLLERAGFRITSSEYGAFATMGEVLGWEPYWMLMQNRVINKLARWLSILKCELLNRRDAGELIIRATKR